MVYLGKKVSDKTFQKIEQYLRKWLAEDEEIIAVLNASKFSKPVVNGLVFTNHRLLVASKPLALEPEFSHEIAADDIVSFTSEKGFFRGRKLYLLQNGGDRKYLGMIFRDDADHVSSLLPGMSGRHQQILDQIETDKKMGILRS